MVAFLASGAASYVTGQVIAVDGAIDVSPQLPTALHVEIKQALIRSLRLPITGRHRAIRTPLFGEGLGLDSINVLEIVLELERTFGVTDQGRRDRCEGPAVG